MADSKYSWITNIPPYAWAFIALIVFGILGSLIFIVLKMLKDKDITTAKFSITEKNQIQAESRELSDNQMRGAREILSWIRIQLRQASDTMFIDQDYLERAYLELLFKYVITELMEQFRLDLVRNHIVKKTDLELKEYAEAKADIYYMMVQGIISKCNSDIPRLDLNSLLSNITKNDFYEIYYKAYLNAKRLSVGY